MLRETIKDLIKSGVFQAWLDGEELEYKDMVDEWVPCDSPGFVYPANRYRIKSKYREPTLVDYGKTIEVSNYIDGEYVERRFLTKFNDMFYCINPYDETVSNAWKYARVKRG